MPGHDPIDSILSTPVSGYDPSLTANAAKTNHTDSIDAILATPVKGGITTNMGTPGVGGSNPNYNTTDASQIDTGAQAENVSATNPFSTSFWKNSFNDARQAYYSAKLQAIVGKEQVGGTLGVIPWAKFQGPQAVQDLYYGRVKDLDNDLKLGKLTKEDYAAQKASLDADKQKADLEMEDYKRQEQDVQKKIDGIQVNPHFKINQEIVNKKGDAASIWDRAFSGAGNSIGSTASFVLPNLLADFGNKAMVNLTKTAALNLLPVGGEVADAIGVGAAAVGTILTHLATRASEADMEIAGPYQDSVRKLSDAYLKAHPNLSDVSQIPEDDQRDIRNQSRQGIEQQFKTNMLLSATDIAEGILLPGSNIGYGIGKYAKGMSKALGLTEHLAEEASYYGKLAKIGSRVGKEYLAMQGEGFEEGLQQVAQYRADDANARPLTGSTKDQEAAHDKETSWGHVISNALQDGYNTISSIDLIPGMSSTNMGGKYTDNADFQQNVFGGQFLGSLTAGPLTALAIVKDIQKFKVANQDLIKSGVLDADGKFQALRNSVLEKYFKNGQVEYLAGALRDLKNAKTAEGDAAFDASEIDKTAKDIKKAYELYQDINDHVDTRVGKDRVFGMFESSELASAKDKLRSDIFNAATNIVAHSDDLGEIEQLITAQQAKESVFSLTQDQYEDQRKTLGAQQEAIQKSLDAHETSLGRMNYYSPASNIESHIKALKDKLKAVNDEVSKLEEDNGKRDTTPPSAALVELMEHKNAKELYLNDAKAKYAELSKIRTKQQLKDYVAKNATRPDPAKGKAIEIREIPARPVAATKSTTPAQTQVSNAPTFEERPNGTLKPLSEVEDATPNTQSAQVSSPEDEDRKLVQGEFKAILEKPGTPQEKGAAIDDVFRQAYTDMPETLSVKGLMEDMRDNWFADDPTYFRKNFAAIHEALSAHHVGQAPFALDDSMGFVDPMEAASIPPLQNVGVDDLNEGITRLAREAGFEPGTGNKITDALSIAQSNTAYDTQHSDDGMTDRTQFGDLRDANGELVYNDTDQQLNNTAELSVGTEVYYRLEKDILNKDIMHDDNYDKAEIGVYKTVKSTKGGVTIEHEVRVGAVHTMSFLRKQLSDTNNGMPIDVEAEKQRNRTLRQTIVQAGKDAEPIKTTIKAKGFGYLNLGAQKLPINTALKGDLKPYITVIDNTGRPIPVGDTQFVNIQGKGLIPGAAVLAVPNGDVFVPIYLNKGMIGGDKTIHATVLKSIQAFLATGARKELQDISPEGEFGARAYVYVTSSKKDLLNMSPGSGIYAFVDDQGVPSVKIGAKTFTGDNSQGLDEAVAKIYVNVNRRLAQGEYAKKYNASLRDSNALTTNVQPNPIILNKYDSGEYSFLKEGDQYQYFSQHTLVTADPLEKAAIIVESKVAIAEGEPDIMAGFEHEPEVKTEDKFGNILEGFDDLHDADVPMGDEDKGILNKVLVSEKISPSLQNTMVDSLAYMLKPDLDGKRVSSDVAKATLEERAAAYEKMLADPKTAPALVSQLKVRLDKYKLFIEHFDALEAKARELLESLGVRKVEAEDDFSDINQQEAAEEGNPMDQYGDEYSSTRNEKEFLDTDLKILIHFIPKLVSLNLSNPNDLASFKETGKNYKQVANELGFKSFNNFNDTYQKALAITSSEHYDSTIEGLNALLTKMKDPNNDPVVQELALALEAAPLKTRISFFNHACLQSQKNMTLMYIVKKTTKWVDRVKEEFNKKTAYLFRSDRRSAVIKVMSDLQNEFMVSGTELMHIVHDEALNKRVYMINTAVAQKILDEATAIADNDASYIQRTKRSKGTETQEPSDTFTSDAKIALYRIVKRTGINIQFAAFCDLLRLGNRSLSKQGGERVVFQDLFLHKYLKTLAGNNKATSEGTPFEENSPFKQETSVIKAMAEQEIKYRVMRTNGAYRMDGKSYFSYTRHNVVSEMFQQLKKGSNFLTGKLTFDAFAKESRILQGIQNSLPGMKPELFYELGSKNKGSNDPAKLLKDMTPREHTITRISQFQNDGKPNPVFMYDTLSDKVTKFLVSGIGKISIQGMQRNADGTIWLADRTMDELMRYFTAEQNRIMQVQLDNKEFNDPTAGKAHKIIKGYHDVLDKHGKVKKEGMGKRFNVYHFLNKEFLDIDNKTLSDMMYNSDGTLKEELPLKAIKREVNKHFNKLFDKNKKDWSDMGLFTMKDDKGNLIGDVSTIIDHNYLMHGVTVSDSNRTVESPHGILYHLGIAVTRDQNRLLNEGRYAELLGEKLLNDIIDYAVVDYVVNSSMFSSEMLMLTGDPAQAGKLADSDTIEKVKSEYANNPAEINRMSLMAHIVSTFTNVSKRNASLTASGTKGVWKTANYNLAIANDIAINSNHMAEYKAMFPDNVSGIEKAYAEGDLTDAQEFTTVEEHLHAMAAFDKISYETYKKALFLMDRKGYDALYPHESEHISDDERKHLVTLVLQAQKPMQRTYTVEADQKMSKQYYVKTSAHPIVPDLVVGTPLEHLLEDMRKKGVNRVAFVSGVKQGTAGAKDLFTTDKDGKEVYNSGFLADNINVLDRNGFRMQVEVPYKEAKDAIREGTQQSKLMFVDIPHALEVDFRGKQTPVGEVQHNYIDYHKKILALHRKELLAEITDQNGKLNVRKLSKILQEEGKDRGYAMGSLLGLDIDEKGQFKIPLTFLPDVGRIEPILTSILSSRLCRFKMPGNSDVQSSEWWLKTGKKGKIVSGENLAEALSEEDRRNILWTKPEYANTNKLQFLHKDTEGKVHNSQLLITPFFIKDGEKVDLRQYIKVVSHNGIDITVLDTDRIDPELLQTNGFRIPFQGHNSGMWFEIIGFLPENLGNLVVVPGEIAGQMGSDYDVDKLYRYTYNYVHKETSERLGANDEEWQSLKRATSLKLVDMGVEPDENGKYSKEVYQRALAAVVEETYVDKGKAVPKHTVVRKNASKYDIAKVHEDDPRSVEGLQNAIIDAQKAIYTSPDPGIMRAILDPLSFKDVKQAISENGAQGTTEFLGAMDPIYQRDGYFSNVTGKLATAICANANTSHAMAQTSNLFVKGQGVVFYDEHGGTYSDRTSVSDHNRVNAYDANAYQYEDIINEVPKLVDQNSGSNNSAWRLDKVFTFPDPVTGVVHRISNLISQLLGVSVDNAKEQLLGAFGINKENLSTALTIIRSGFTLNMVNAFINQPILKKYYEAIGDAEDMYDLDFVANKANAAVSDLFTKYGKMAGMDNDAINNLVSRKGINGVKYSDMKASLKEEITPANAMQQLEILKAYLRYKQISESLATLTGTFGIDVKGLPANMAQTYKKAQDIDAILSDSEVLGNVERYSQNTIPGVFADVPKLAVRLFMDSSNPAIAYTSATYMEAKNLLMEVAGKKQLYAEQIDTFHAHAKQFIYSGFRLDSEDIRDGRKRLLFDTPENESLQTKLQKLKVEYPNNELLDSIGLRTSDNPSNPKLIMIEPSSEGDYVQRIKDQWENMLRDDEHPQLKSFAVDMVKYAMWVQPQEFGSSSITKYLPDVYMIKSGLSDYLQRVNAHTSDPDLLTNFVRQFIQHNPDVLTSTREKQMDKIQWFRRPGQVTNKFTGETYQGQINVSVDSFQLPAIPKDPAEFSKNKAAGLIRNGAYPKYLRFYTDEVGDQVYEQSENPDGSYTYNRITKLGDTDVSEYDMVTPYEVHDKSVTFAGTLVHDNVINDVTPSSVAVSTALKATGGINAEKRPDYMTFTEVDDILGGLIAKANEVSVDPKATTKDRAYAKYYVFLAGVLQHNLKDVRVSLSENQGTAGHTSADGKTVTFSATHFKDLMRGLQKGRSGLSPELERERTVLHEFIHAKIFQGLAEGKHTAEYKKIEEVHEAFKKAIRSSDVIRGVDVSALDAELFSILKDAFDDKRSDLGENFVDFVTNTIKDEVKLRQYFEQVGQKLEDMANKGLLADKNYDLVSNESRFAAFRDHVQKSFKKGALNPMINKYYAYHSIDEFITEAMTNAKVQDTLRGIPGLWKTFVNSLKDFIAKLLGIEDVERTLLDDALDSIFAFMGKPDIKAPDTQDTQVNFTEGNTEQVPTGMSDDTQEKLGSATKSIKKKEDLLNEGQKEAVTKVMKIIEDKHHDNIFDDMFLLSGKGGTGKTFTTEVVIDKILAMHPMATIAHVAPTWNAVNEIMKASEDPSKKASTFASFVGTELSQPNANGVQQFILNKDEKVRKFPPAVFTADYIILDEASMIGGDGQPPMANSKGEMVSTDAWETLKYRLHQREEWYGSSPKKIILVGDYAQIPPVGTKPDHDAIIIEKMLAKPETHHVLTQNMRLVKNPDAADLDSLHETYRKNIDKAREAFKRGEPSNKSIDRNPVPFATRKDSRNIKYIRTANDAVEKFTKIYLQDPENVTNVVFVNYNNYSRPETQELIGKIRAKLFPGSNKTFNPGELTILSGNMASKILIDGTPHGIIWHNETRFHVKAVEENVKKRVRQGDFSFEFEGTNMTLITDYGKKRVEFVQFIPHPEEITRIFGRYDNTVKGFKTEDGTVVPYGVYLEFKKSLPILNYGYVVNSHKVQGSSYEHTFVDEENLLKSPDTNKGFNNMMYTAVSRPKQTLTILNLANPSEQTVTTKRTWNANDSSVPLGINISTKSDDPLGRALTNPTWGSKKDGKDYFDVESWYKQNKSKSTDPVEAMQADMNTIFRGILHKFTLHPELVDQITQRGGVNFLEASSHLVGVSNSRWEGTGKASKFIRVLIAAYEQSLKNRKGVDDLTADDIITDLITRGLLKTKC